MLGTFSRKLSRTPGLGSLMGEVVVHVRSAREVRRLGVSAIVGWGLRPTTKRPRAIAAKLGLPFIALEDGFLRSFGTGATHPTLSLVVDQEGIYYDASKPSGLEQLLNSSQDLLSGPGADFQRARSLIFKHRLSKYNSAPEYTPPLRHGKRVLVVDQTRRDAGITYGQASSATFGDMLQAAYEEHPDATIYVKTHPEVVRGDKQGYYNRLENDSRTVLIQDAIAPQSLLEYMDHVYVATSHLGFEALLLGKTVTCFGVPWYAGWGTTDDRQATPRRQRTRSVDELFAAAYMHYTRYLDPETHRQGNIFDIIHWLIRQRTAHEQQTGRRIAIGFRRWKARNLAPFFGLDQARTFFVGSAAVATTLRPCEADQLLVWGTAPAPEIEELAHTSGARLVRVEDGFVRSVGLGSDFVPPSALVLDEIGIYFDARRPSGLERLLSERSFSEEDRTRAKAVRELIVKHEITKYNIEPNQKPAWTAGQRRIVLVPGQVEDDASILYGCGPIRSNLALLQAARQASPDAYIVYKPHPDVSVRNRNGRLARDEALRYADYVETRVSIVSCVNACDEVHTMTSLSGFEGLLRGKRVVTYGQPFYAGWGLTEDKLPIARRARVLTLDELVAGTLLHYPIYWDWVLRGYTTCEAVLNQIIKQRDKLVSENKLNRVRKSYLERILLKIGLWARAGFMVRR
ncbi:capsular polysaccharide biosynthesis protein [Bordetella hinzii]|uniref:capsular polysaccharide biosynthesis protein n=1 Tax=Bordetella hinzii TaxID=103855 RepID=UPI0039FBA078